MLRRAALRATRLRLGTPSVSNLSQCSRSVHCTPLYWKRTHGRSIDYPQNMRKFTTGSEQDLPDRNMCWCFRKREDILDLLENERQIGANLHFSSQMQLKQLNTSVEDIEQGAIYAYMHIADMFNRSNPEEFSNAVTIMDRDLAERFARQAQLFRLQGVRPQLEVSRLSARLLYSIVTFKEIEPDFSSLPARVLGSVHRRLGDAVAILIAYLGKLRAQDEVALQLYIHYSGQEAVTIVPRSPSEDPAAALAAEDLAAAAGEAPPQPPPPHAEGAAAPSQADHVWVLEARMSLETFASQAAIPTEPAAAAGADPDEEAPAGPQMRWLVKDVDWHMLSQGIQHKYNVRTPRRE